MLASPPPAQNENSLYGILFDDSKRETCLLFLKAVRSIYISIYIYMDVVFVALVPAAGPTKSWHTGMTTFTHKCIFQAVGKFKHLCCFSFNRSMVSMSFILIIIVRRLNFVLHSSHYVCHEKLSSHTDRKAFLFLYV